MEERLQKIMARAGLGSRRDCEVLIKAGRVSVNGVVSILGTKADTAKDKILVDGNPIGNAETLVYVALHKPRGVLSTVDTPDSRKTVSDLVPLPGTLYPVGRLDVDSEGLILMTNDGDLANRLTHPRYGHEKEYRVLVARQPDNQQIEAWQHGIVLEDGYRTAPAQVSVESKFGRGAWLRVTLKEGRKRQIREMGMRTGLPVVRIIRVRIGTLEIGTLKAGDWRNLSPREVIDLKSPTGAVSRKRISARSSELKKFHPANQAKSRKKTSHRYERSGRPETGQRSSGPAKGRKNDRSAGHNATGSAASGNLKPAKNPVRRSSR